MNKEMVKMLNDSLNEIMEKNPESDAVEIMQKSIMKFYDDAAVILGWTDAEKQKQLDKYFDIYNDLTKE